MGLKFKNTAAIKRELPRLRRQAQSNATSNGWRFTRGREMEFILLNPNGRADDPIAWNGSASVLAEVVKMAESIPDCTEISLSGGVDGFDSFQDMMDPWPNYEPWAGDWELVVWERNPVINIS